MKSLSLSRPLILMVIGVPGSGKSFFARQFASTFSTPIVNYDYIRSRLFETPSFSNKEEAVVYSLAGQQITELLKTEKTFIVDGGLNDKNDRASLAKIALKAGYDSLVVWVQTDEPASKMRSTRRNAKRSGDELNASLTAEQFATLSKELTSPTGQEAFIVISGKHTFATQAKAVLKKLVQPRQELAQKPNAYSAQKYDQSQPPTAPPRRNVIIN